MPSSLVAQNDPVIRSVYLIGNTGTDTIPSEAMQLLAFECFDDSLAAVVMLGDNVFNAGNYEDSVSERARIASKKLEAQFEMFVGFNGYFFLVPGEHDWANGRRRGKSAVQAQERTSNNWFAQSIVRNKTEGVYMPGKALPGPVSLDLPDNLRVVFIDTQWILQKGLFKPRASYPGMSNKATKNLFYSRLDSLIADGRSKGKNILVAGHHPVYSNGRRVHVIEPLRSLIEYTPLQLFGLMGLNRYFRQDLVHPPYRKMRRRLHSIFSKYPGIVCASAHEHGLEAFEKDSVIYIVSGSGSFTKPLDRYRFPAFFMDDLQTGFFKLTYHSSGAIYLHAYGVSDRGEFWKRLIRKGENVSPAAEKEEGIPEP